MLVLSKKLFFLAWLDFALFCLVTGGVYWQEAADVTGFIVSLGLAGSVLLLLLIRLDVYRNITSAYNPHELAFRLLACVCVSNLVVWPFVDASIRSTLFGITSTAVVLFGIRSGHILGLYRKAAPSAMRAPVTLGKRKLAIYGAGAAGVKLEMALRGSKSFVATLFVDQDEQLVGRKTNNIPIFSPSEIAPRFDQYAITDVAIAIPSLSKKERLTIIQQLSPVGRPIIVVPSLEEIISGRREISELDGLDVNDLLERDPVAPDTNLCAQAIRHTDTVFITGAGGTIGGQLAIEIAQLRPKILVLIDQSELGLYTIERQLGCYVGETKVLTKLGDICDTSFMQTIAADYPPSVVFHAAAYKHVPLIEDNVVMALKNNLRSALSVIAVCERFAPRSCVLVSSDKAVRPTNVMGASKRVCELIFQAQQQRATETTIFSMVRFGNVLGSSGSVVPLFEEQIRKHQVVNVTHPEVTRYFMSIPEAAQLVIQASAMARGGDVFLLDMGDPIKILDLANLMIALAGKTVKTEDNPVGDVEIVFSGLRPGEKLYEELLMDDNSLPTAHPKIKRAVEEHLPYKKLDLAIMAFDEAIDAGDKSKLMELLGTYVHGYKTKEADISE